MCTPLLALGLLGTGVQAAGMIMQGQQANAMAQAQAAAIEQQRKADAAQATYEIGRERHQQELAAARARAAVGASGVGMAGSPTEVMAANAVQGELDIQAIRYGSQLRQNALGTQADITRMQGRQAKTAGYIGAFGTAIGGLTDAYSRSIQMGKNPLGMRA